MDVVTSGTVLGVGPAASPTASPGPWGRTSVRTPSATAACAVTTASPSSSGTVTPPTTLGRATTSPCRCTGSRTGTAPSSTRHFAPGTDDSLPGFGSESCNAYWSGAGSPCWRSRKSRQTPLLPYFLAARFPCGRLRHRHLRRVQHAGQSAGRRRVPDPGPHGRRGSGVAEEAGRVARGQPGACRFRATFWSPVQSHGVPTAGLAFGRRAAPPSSSNTMVWARLGGTDAAGLAHAQLLRGRGSSSVTEPWARQVNRWWCLSRRLPFFRVGGGRGW